MNSFSSSRIWISWIVMVAGCGSGVGTDSPIGSPGTSGVETCRRLGYTDELIDYVTSLTEIGRDAGYSAEQQVAANFDGCALGYQGVGGCENNPNVGVTITYDECVFTCSMCTTAIIDEVYGR